MSIAYAYNAEGRLASMVLPSGAEVVGLWLDGFTRFSEGIALLRRAFAKDGDPLARATNAGWIAVGEARRGSRNDAERWLETARAIQVRAHTLRLAERWSNASGSVPPSRRTR